MLLSDGTRLGSYEILSALGAGGMGEVYRATDRKLARDVALKVLPAEMASQPERLARFQREARAVAALNHPHIVTIHSVEESGGVHFITMELVEGQSLDRLIPESGLTLEKILEISTALADALAAAYGHAPDARGRRRRCAAPHHRNDRSRRHMEAGRHDSVRIVRQGAPLARRRSWRKGHDRGGH